MNYWYYTYKYQHFILFMYRGNIVKKVLILLIFGGLMLNSAAFAIQDNNKNIKIQVRKTKKQPEQSFTLNPYWESYNDELLNGYISEGLENNLNIKIAQARIKESEAILGTVKAERLPQLSINPSIYPFKTISRWTGNFGSGNHLYFPLLLNWELDIFGKLSDKVKSSKISVKISQEDLNIAKLAISSEITASYFNIILEDALIEN